MHKSQKILKVHPDDNLIVALQNLEAGAVIEVEGQTITLPAAVERKHKFVQHDIAAQQEVLMYGVVVGKANFDLPQGTAITTANVSHKTSKVTARQPRLDWPKPDVSKWREKTFLGYKRSDGSVGTANYWLVFPLVFCENKNIDVLKEAISEALGYSKYDRYKAFAKQLVQNAAADQPVETVLSDFLESGYQSSNPFKNVDGVRFITHTMGCGGTRQDANSLCGLLAGYLHNANVAGATILSLGCQNAQFDILKAEIEKRNPNFDKPLFYFDQQTLGSEEKLLESAIKATIEGLKIANECRREPAPLSKLVIGLECGGSDGFSGISANPVLGVVSDTLVALGGTTVLSEFPELCGVEQELCDRCTDDELATRFLELMEKYEASAIRAGSSFDMNPSPGNIKDGLITDAMKSAGAAKKGGSSPVTDVLDYPEPITKAGLNLLCTPGNDAECTTALAGSGSNIILFTTGLGTPLGNPVVPVVKISSNSTLAQKMHDIIDVDAGGIIEGKASIQDVADLLMQYIIDLASGNKKTKAMLNEQYDFIPWKRGVSL
jgi:altronate hydrolase